MNRTPCFLSRLAGAVLAVALVGCGESEPAPAPSPEAPAAKPPTEPDPEPAAPPKGGSDVELGMMQYTVFCASCHGSDGSADTPMAASLDPRPTAHSDGRYMNGLSDDYLFQIIKEGGAAVGKSPLMAPWGGSLTDEQIRQVIAFIRSLAVPPYEPGLP